MKVVNWVKTGDHAGFPFTKIPAYVAIPMLPCLVHLRLWTAGLALFCTFIVWYMDKKGYTLTWLINRMRGRMIGNRISARPTWFIRRFSYLDDPAKD